MIKPMVLKRSPSTQEEVNQLISAAIKCLEKRLRYCSNKKFNHTKDVCSYLRLQLAEEKEEVFAVMFLNSHHQLIAFEKLFYGAINEVFIYPRKMIRKSLEYNASKLIISHNHPSQSCVPSKADCELTRTLKNTLSIIDVKLMDHVIISHRRTFSFAAHCLL